MCGLNNIIEELDSTNHVRLSNYVKNISGTYKYVTIHNKKYAILINDENAMCNSYLYSVYSHYIHCAKEEVIRYRMHHKYPYLITLLNLFGKLLQKGDINQTVFVNPTLVSTDNHQNIDNYELKEVVNYLKRLYPKHAIVFRCINDYTHRQYLKDFEEAGFMCLLYRQIYFFNPMAKMKTKKIKKIKNDITELENGLFEVKEVHKLEDSEVEQVLEFYKRLYIDKYSKFNPQYTKEFIFKTQKNSSFHYLTLNKNGKVIGVIGYMKEKEMLIPFFLGYEDTCENVYRLLQAALYKKAFEEKCIIHQGAGAPTYKTQRGAFSAFEYMYVYTKHLPKRNQLTWKGLKMVVDILGNRLLNDIEGKSKKRI